MGRRGFSWEEAPPPPSLSAGGLLRGCSPAVARWGEGGGAPRGRRRGGPPGSPLVGDASGGGFRIRCYLMLSYLMSSVIEYKYCDHLIGTISTFVWLQ